ncbi:MAG: CBS domain-containing protein [Desulfurococcales archaeon]|nr:CBS domain-containing protein [Desulfurococcales archaeon]
MPHAEEFPVVSLITKQPIVMKPEDTVDKAVSKMAEENVGSVIIVDDKLKPIGIFTERDLLIKVCAKGLDPSRVKLGDVMTRRLVTIKESEPARRALETMLHFGFRHLPVVDSSGRLVGVISIKDVSRPFVGEVDVEELHSAG